MNNNLNSVIKEYVNNDYSINKINRGYVHRKWIVTINSKNKMFIKEFTNISHIRMEFINYIQELIRDYCPQIIKNRDGKSYTDIDNVKYVAYEFIHGETLKKRDLTSNELLKIGKFMAKLHKAMREICIPDEFTEKDCLRIGDDNLEKMKKLSEQYKIENNQDYIKIIKYKMLILEKISNTDIQKAKTQLKKQVVHGDFYLDNLINKDKKLIITDLDQVCVFYKMYEVIRGMMMIAFDEGKTDTENIKKIISFLKGYQEENILENMDMSINLYLYTLANSLYCLQENDYMDFHKKKFAFTRYNMLKWLYENKEIIIKNIEREEFER